MKKKRSRIISPRLLSGDSRESIYHRLPAEIKAGLRHIAQNENESIGWVLEKVVIKYFGFRPPKYIKRKRYND